MSSAVLDSANFVERQMDNPGSILWEADAQSWQVIYVSPHAVSVLRYPLEQWYAPHFWVEHLHPEDKESIVKKCPELMASLDQFDLNYRMLASDGSVKWFHDVIGVIRESGVPTRIRGCMVEIDEMRQNAEDHRRLLAFEMMLSRLFATFINLPLAQVDDQIENALEELCEHLRTDRATFASMATREAALIVTHSWARPDLPPVPRKMEGEMFPWLLERLVKGENVIVPSTESLPPEACEEKKYMLATGVKSTIVIPLRMEGELVGAISTDSFHDTPKLIPDILDRFSLAGSVFVNLLARKRADKEIQNSYSKVKDLKEDLEKRLQFETMLAELSATFVDLPADQVDSQIGAAQKRICEALGLERSTLFQMFDKASGLTRTSSWAKEGIDPFPHLSMKELPWCAHEIQAGQMVSFERIDHLPEEAAIDKETFRRFGPKSNVTIPLSAGGKVIGALAFSTLREERKWPTSHVHRLGLVAKIFANALARKNAAETLQTSFSEIAELKDRLKVENTYLREEIVQGFGQTKVVGQSDGIREVLSKAKQVAGTDAAVLILGETGTGKELIATMIHQWSRRNGRALIKLNCAALPATLVESELFGREKGAYTGALSREVGRFELADRSTILLDEIGETPLELQTKLLRVLQEGEFERLGSSKTIRVDVRVIAATSRNLREMVKEGKFREDLFYRLNVFSIHIPPLRERREDIQPLMWHLIQSVGGRMGRKVEGVRASTLKQFQDYSWPGNVREMRNIIERFLILKPGSVFQAELPILDDVWTPPGSTLEQIESAHILRVLDATRWRVRGKGGAAEILGLKPTTLEARLKKLKIIRPS